MGFIDFLKKITGMSRVEESKIETERVAFDEIENWVENKRKEIGDREKEIFGLIKNRISVVIKELDEKVRALESIDLESKKVEGRIKLIVRENLNNYINHVKNLIENLYNLKEENLEKFVARINEIFLDFDKKSFRNYQKATFLIGKEIAAVKGSIIKFSRYSGKVLNEDKNLVSVSKIISFIESKLRQIDETNETTGRIDERIRSLDRKIKNLKEMNKKVLEEIEKSKNRKSYVENLKKREETKSDETELAKEVYKLKEMIDFKILGNIFHVSEKKMNIVKSHKEDFLTAFQKDSGASILGLLDESKLNSEIISAKIKHINDKQEEITKNKETIKKDETEDLLVEIKNVKLEIKNLNNEKVRELKRSERLKINREGVINSIKQELDKINVIILDI